MSPIKSHLSERLPALAEVSKGRDHLTTSEFAGVVRMKDGSVRKSYRLTGNCCGVTPVIVGRALLWPVVDVVRIFQTTKEQQHGAETD